MAIDVVTAQSGDQRELALEQMECGIALRRGIFLELQIAFHDEPANVVRAGERCDLGRSIGIDGGIEERDGELRGAAGGEIKRLLAGDENDSVLEGNAGLGEAEQFVELGQIRSWHSKRRERGKRGVLGRAAG